MVRDAGTAPLQPEGIVYKYLPRLFSLFLSPVLSLWARTLNIHKYGSENIVRARRKGGVIYAIWHGNMAVPVYVMRNQGLTALVSPVYVGELIAGLVRNLGYEFVRASSNYKTIRGLRTIIRILKENHDFAIMLDGPSGPARTVQAGVVNLAAITGKPIILGYAACEKAFHLPTWDESEWPYPFTRVAFEISEEIYVPRKLSPSEEDAYREKIRDRLLKLQEDAEKKLAVITAN